MLLNTNKMKSFFKNYIDKSRQEQIRSDIETSINSIVSTTKRLPYSKQVEAVERIKQSFKQRKIELEEELEEVKDCISRM